jgi:hypothetical protein
MLVKFQILLRYQTPAHTNSSPISSNAATERYVEVSPYFTDPCS